jgi:hypothetical protein
MSLIKKGKLFYTRIVRAYACRLGDKPADRIYQILCSLKFWVEHRYWPHIRNPRSFSEKICHRMLLDRNPAWTMISDKLAVRDYVAARIGGDYLVPLLWRGFDPEAIPWDVLPNGFIIKTNHGCGFNIIVRDKNRLDRPKATRQLREWLSRNFTYSSFVGMAWAYRNIVPEILVEGLLDDNGALPMDYKFFCYSGRAEYLQVSVDRHGRPSEQILDRNFDFIPLYNGVEIYRGKLERPSNYQQMRTVAETLAEDLDFIRVDLYSVSGRIYFGELTLYPAGGLARFVPRRYDFAFGESWNIRIHSGPPRG